MENVDWAIFGSFLLLLLVSTRLLCDVNFSIYISFFSLIRLIRIFFPYFEFSLFKNRDGLLDFSLHLNFSNI